MRSVVINDRFLIGVTGHWLHYIVSPEEPGVPGFPMVSSKVSTFFPRIVGPTELPSAWDLAQALFMDLKRSSSLLFEQMHTWTMFEIPPNFPAWHRSPTDTNVINSLANSRPAELNGSIKSPLARSGANVVEAPCIAAMPSTFYTREDVYRAAQTSVLNGNISFGSYELINCIYIFGGMALDVERVLQEEKSGKFDLLNATTVLGVYHCSQDSGSCVHGALVSSAWILSTPLDSPMGACSVSTMMMSAVVNEAIFLIGGASSTDDSSTAAEQLSSTTCRFDLVTGEVKVMDSLPFGLFETQALVGKSESSLFIPCHELSAILSVGRYIVMPFGFNTQAHSGVFAYDTIKDSWTYLKTPARGKASAFEGSVPFTSFPQRYDN